MWASTSGSPACIVLTGQVARAGLAPATGVLGHLVVVAGAVLHPALELEVRHVAARLRRPLPDDLERPLQSAPRTGLGEPAVGDPAHAAQCGGGIGADPDRDGTLHRQRRQPGGLNVVEASVHGHAPLGPQGAQHGDLLLQDGTSLLERHPQRVVLHLVPADPEPEPEAAAAEQVDLGRLLGEQRRLALGPDQDGGREGEVRAAGQVREHRQRLAEGVVDRVGTAEIAVHRRVRAEHVVVGRQVGVAEVRDRLSQGADCAPVAAHLGLGEDDADVHGRSLPCSQVAMRRRPRIGAARLAWAP